jgi:hypothetical protein
MTEGGEMGFLAVVSCKNLHKTAIQNLANEGSEVGGGTASCFAVDAGSQTGFAPVRFNVLNDRTASVALPPYPICNFSTFDR